MSYLYLTADRVGIATGGGLVTKHELGALIELSNEKGQVAQTWGNEHFVAKSINGTFLPVEDTKEPWYFDAIAADDLRSLGHGYKLAHAYAGTFSRTVAKLKERSCKVSYTAAAHDVKVSREEHERLGFAYDYPHITQPDLWARYVAGYLQADVLICPSKHSADVMRGFGATNRIEIIPHGCDLPETIKPLPQQKIVGYCGSYGPDKGVIYLLQAWKLLNRKDATLVLAGRDSTSPIVGQWIEQIGCGNVRRLGWQDSIGDFYDSIDLYIQPSASEGFGIEVLEAAASSRAVICSDGAGASDLIDPAWVFQARNVEQLASKLNLALNAPYLAEVGAMNRKMAANYTWDKIRNRYIKLWKELI